MLKTLWTVTLTMALLIPGVTPGAFAAEGFRYICFDPMGMKLLIFDSDKSGKVIYKIQPTDDDFSTNPFLVHYALPERFTAGRVEQDKNEPSDWYYYFETDAIKAPSGNKLKFKGYIKVDTANPAEASMDVETHSETPSGERSTTHSTPKLSCDWKIRMKNPFSVAP